MAVQLQQKWFYSIDPTVDGETINGPKLSTGQGENQDDDEERSIDRWHDR